MNSIPPRQTGPDREADSPVPVPTSVSLPAPGPAYGPAPVPAEAARRRLGLSTGRVVQSRAVPEASVLARRRRVLRSTKWTLPVVAALLLGTVAAWPELDRSMHVGRATLREVAALKADTGRMLSARYRGLDAHDRPYMVTSRQARQIGPERVDLDHPAADSFTEGGTWLYGRSLHGVYMQHAQLLDLSGRVMLYRDDGTIMHSPTADIDVRRGIVASDDWIHAEGPFGVLDAQGYLMSNPDGLAQFRGPARLVLNDDHVAHAQPAPSAAASTAGTRPR